MDISRSRTASGTWRFLDCFACAFGALAMTRGIGPAPVCGGRGGLLEVLGADEAGEGAVGGKEIFVCALFHDFPVRHHHNQVRVSHRA